MSREMRAKAIVDAIDGGVVAERPAFKHSTVLRCSKCLARYDLADPKAAKQVAGPCLCGGTIAVIGYYGRLAPRRTT